LVVDDFVVVFECVEVVPVAAVPLVDVVPVVSVDIAPPLPVVSVVVVIVVLLVSVDIVPVVPVIDVSVDIVDELYVEELSVATAPVSVTLLLFVSLLHAKPKTASARMVMRIRVFFICLSSQMVAC
jgi:hypothetical protein